MTVAALAAFAVLTVLVGAGATLGLDASLLAASQASATPGLDLTGSLLTALGHVAVTSAVVVGIAAARRGRHGLALAALFLAGLAVEVALKSTLPHPAPPTDLSRDLGLLPSVGLVLPGSFPSGHLVRTTFIAGVLAPAASVPARIALALLLVAMALSRVYLAQHWPSDVAGGILLGAGLAALFHRILAR